MQGPGSSGSAPRLAVTRHAAAGVISDSETLMRLSGRTSPKTTINRVYRAQRCAFPALQPLKCPGLRERRPSSHHFWSLNSGKTDTKTTRSDAKTKSDAKLHPDVPARRGRRPCSRCGGMGRWRHRPDAARRQVRPGPCAALKTPALQTLISGAARTRTGAGPHASPGEFTTRIDLHPQKGQNGRESCQSTYKVNGSGLSDLPGARGGVRRCRAGRA